MLLTANTAIKLLGAQNIAVTLAAAVILSVLVLQSSDKIFGAYQQLGYSGKRFFKWTRSKNNMVYARYVLLSLLIFLSSAVVNLSFSFIGINAASYLGFLMFVLFYVIYIYSDGKYALKVPLKNTDRVIRLKVTFAALCFIVSALLMTGFSALSNLFKVGETAEIVHLLRYIPLSFLPLLTPFLLIAAGFVNRAYETPKNNSYIKKAKEKLSGKNFITVGITGSYGKTSVKNILKTVLSEKYKVLATPDSFNTPLGIASTINNSDLEGVEVFIAEMGAKHTGDVAELCNIVQPDYSVITGICPQHLETFKSVENIKKAKFELIENTKADGIAVFGRGASELYDKCTIQKYLVGKDITAENELLSERGSIFDMKLEGRILTCKTVLLGAHNIQNIMLAAMLANKMGLSDDEIISGIEKVQFEKHRLELLKPDSGMNILDDSYNSNISGARAALDVLKLFKGKKYVITPGLVELGVLEEEENYALGQSMSFCDRVFLVGETLVVPVKNGLLSTGFEPEKITVTATLDLAVAELAALARQGDTVLFLNDLPDIYK